MTVLIMNYISNLERSSSLKPMFEKMNSLLHLKKPDLVKIFLLWTAFSGQARFYFQ